MEEVGGEGAGGQRWQQWDHSFHPVTILMLPLRDLINDLNEGTEQEGAAVLRSNNQEGRQTGERKASSSQRLELRKHGWILLYDTVCGWDTAVPHLHTGSGCLAKWEHAGRHHWCLSRWCGSFTLWNLQSKTASFGPHLPACCLQHHLAQNIT